MEKTLSVAKFLYDSYSEYFGHSMEQMKMHKLMYFVQLVSLMYHKELLFEEPFLGWRYGPVLCSVRHEYATGNLFSDVSGDVTERTRRLAEQVLERYGSLSQWKLSSLSHREFSWKRARRGMEPSDNGNVELDLSAMKVDAVKELAERKWHNNGCAPNRLNGGV